MLCLTLTVLPTTACIWSMQSLMIINMAGNKLEVLPDCSYNCPSLEEIHLQDNRLDNLPHNLFKLPKLSILDVSNNKLQMVPYVIWSCPSLTEVNLSLNMLSDLPSAFNLRRHESSLSVSSLSGSEGVFHDALSISSDISNTSDNQSEIDTENEIDDAKQLEEKVSQLQQATVSHCNKWKSCVNIVEKELLNPTVNKEDCKLHYLNLSHNSFKEIPPSLPCLAPHLGKVCSVNILVLKL